MRIVLICYVFPPEHSPAGLMTRELAEDLAAAGHQVTVVTGWPNHPRGVLFPGWRARFRRLYRDPAGYRVLRCGHSIGPRYRLFWRLGHYLTFALSSLANCLALGRIDVVYNDSTPFFGVATAWLLAKLKRARVVYSIMDLHPEGARDAGLTTEGWTYRFLRAVDTFLCTHSDHIVTLSERLKEGIAARGVEEGRIAVVPLWLDPQRIRPGERDNPWRRAQGIATETFVAMYAGTIGHVSGAGMLIDVAGHLADRRDILLLLVGEGPVKEQVHTRAAELGLRNMRFLPFQPEEVLADMQATADVGLVTLLPKGGQTCVPSKTLGYLAAGRPVIASVEADSPTAETVHEGQCGIVVPPQDAPAMAEAIRQAAYDPQRLRQMGLNARRYFLARHSRTVCTKKCQALLTGAR